MPRAATVKIVPATASRWKDLETLRKNWRADRQWEPTWTADRREESYRGWQKAVERTLNWVDVGTG